MFGNVLKRVRPKHVTITHHFSIDYCLQIDVINIFNDPNTESELLTHSEFNLTECVNHFRRKLSHADCENLYKKFKLLK